MKTRSALMLAVAVFAAFIPVSFAAGSPDVEFRPFTLNLKPGSSPATVRSVLGVPDATLNPLVWFYWNFGPNRHNPEFDTLFVGFKDDRLTEVKITDGRVVRQLPAEAERQAKTAAVAAAPAKR